MCQVTRACGREGRGDQVTRWRVTSIVAVAVTPAAATAWIANAAWRTPLASSGAGRWNVKLPAGSVVTVAPAAGSVPTWTTTSVTGGKPEPVTYVFIVSP
jgi:hypothetical protein